MSNGMPVNKDYIIMLRFCFIVYLHLPYAQRQK